MLFGELNESRAARQIPFPPRRDYLDIGIERVIAKLKAHLIIALARRSVADGIGPDQLGNLNLALGNQRPGNRGAEQIKPFIQGIGAHHWEDIIAAEFLADILDEDMLFLDACEPRLLPCGFNLLALAQIGSESDDLTIVRNLEPFDDNAGIQPARIGQHDSVYAGITSGPLNVIAHYRCSRPI